MKSALVEFSTVIVSHLTVAEWLRAFPKSEALAGLVALLALMVALLWTRHRLCTGAPPIRSAPRLVRKPGGRRAVTVTISLTITRENAEHEPAAMRKKQEVRTNGPKSKTDLSRVA